MPKKGKSRNPYRYKKKNNQNWKNRNQIARIPQFRNLAPDSLLLRDSYQCQIKLKPTSTLAGASSVPHVALFRAASGYDIFQPVHSSRENWNLLSGTIATLGSIAAGTDYPRAQYNHYYVLGSKMTATFQPTANNQSPTYHDENNVQVSIGLTRDANWPTAGAASGTSLVEITRAMNSKSRQTFGNTSTGMVGNRVRMSQSYSPKRLLGIKDVVDNDELKVSTINGQPGEETFFYIYLNGLNLGGASDPDSIPNYIINVKIDYLLKFTEVSDQVNLPMNNM